MNKKAMLGTMLIGLVVFAIVFLLWTGIATTVINWLIIVINNLLNLGERVQGFVNPHSIYTIASLDNFKRLDKDISEILNSKEKTANKIIPFNIGEYTIIGFNRDKDLNENCLGKEATKLEGDSCKGKSCLCLCATGASSCYCKAYGDVDYFITSSTQYKNEGKKIEGLIDPLTGTDAHCIKIVGRKGVVDWKMLEVYGSWYHSHRLHLEKRKLDGKLMVYIGRESELKCDNPKESCPDYEGELCCAKGRDKDNNNCTPHYFVFAGNPYFQECGKCLSSCKKADYAKDWLADINPCECSEEGFSCSRYLTEETCNEGSDSDGKKCLSAYIGTNGLYSFARCELCPESCTPDYYQKEELRLKNLCSCVEAQNTCAKYTTEKTCNEGSDSTGKRCLSVYEGEGESATFTRCEICPAGCKIEDYAKEELKTLNPCSCTG